MNLFLHHIYEYKKGLRNLVLHTINTIHRKEIVQKLEKEGISYIIRGVSSAKLNVFFGDRNCINVLETFGPKPLNEFTDEEDFILGIMLGYCRKKQCRRYLSRKGRMRRENGFDTRDRAIARSA